MTDDERRGRVERVARAIYDAATLYIRAADRPVLRADWEANPDKEWTRAQARAAIAAMHAHPNPEDAGLHDGKAVSGKLDEAPRKSASACEVAAYYPAMMEYVTALEQRTPKAEEYLALQSRIAISAHTRMEKAESLARAERSQRESEAEAYRNEIEQLKAALHRIQHSASPFLNAARDIAREALEGRTGT